ncbi:MAG: family 20 glycosylhydrolase [Chloroflexi bacterium]|nr:family 20 glycosylhydrolase [Chloroflexota bacterium]
MTTQTKNQEKNNLLLLPHPRHLAQTGQTLTLPKTGLIALDAPDVQALRFTGISLQTALCKHSINYELAARAAVPQVQTCIQLSVVPGSVGHPEGYELTITSEHIHIVAETPAGVFYAVQTLKQLLQQAGSNLPTLRCRDWPDFANRGLMLDISRDKVPTMDTLYALVDMLASWKINQLQLYTEHTFAYSKHPTVWATASPITGEEILALDDYCRQRFVELIPNQNAFGHMTRWLVHDEYKHLAEAPEGAQTPWGFFEPKPFSLSPAVPESLDLVRDLLDELLPHFSSRQVNVGCDETYDVGQGLSKELVAATSVGHVYLEFLLKIYREVKARGYTMQLWGDIIMEHPELAPQLPRDVIALEWGYEADHPFDEHGAIFAASGVPFYVCPGTSSWRTIAGRTDNAMENLLNAAENGLKHGAVGYLNTDWGDEGHWQPLPVSYLGYAYGAAISWALDENRDLALPKLLDEYVFHDTAGVMGQLVYDLGNVYQVAGPKIHNSSVLFNILQSPLEQLLPQSGKMEKAMATVDSVMARLQEAQMQGEDAELIQREFVWVADMLRHACRRAIWVSGDANSPENTELRQRLVQDIERLLAEHRAIWHARNRPGGFKESQARLEKVQQSYQ